MCCTFGQRVGRNNLAKLACSLYGTRHSKLLEWSHLFHANRKLASKLPAAQVIDELEEEPLTKQSAVLQEKLGDIYSAAGKTPQAIDAYTAALKLEITSPQRVRIMLNLARALNIALRYQEAYDLYKRFLKSNRHRAINDRLDMSRYMLGI